MGVRVPGVPDRGEMGEENEKEKEGKWADPTYKSNKHTLNGGEKLHPLPFRLHIDD